jgi:hypothetical protein
MNFPSPAEYKKTRLATLNRIHGEGMKAFKLGRDESANHYGLHTYEGRAWEAGYIRANKAAKKKTAQ